MPLLKYCLFFCTRIRHYFPKCKAPAKAGVTGRLPEGWLVRPSHGSSTPARISRSRPPCVIPLMGAGTGRKYPPAVVLARQPTTGCFWVGWNRWAPYLAVIYAGLVLRRWSWRILPGRSLLPGMCSGSDIRFSKGREGIIPHALMLEYPKQKL